MRSFVYRCDRCGARSESYATPALPRKWSVLASRSDTGELHTLAHFCPDCSTVAFRVANGGAAQAQEFEPEGAES